MQLRPTESYAVEALGRAAFCFATNLWNAPSFVFNAVDMTVHTIARNILTKYTELSPLRREVVARSVGCAAGCAVTAAVFSPFGAFKAIAVTAVGTGISYLYNNSLA